MREYKQHNFSDRWKNKFTLKLSKIANMSNSLVRDSFVDNQIRGIRQNDS